MIDFRNNTARWEQIAAHLMECNEFFAPPLSSRVDIPEYSRRLELNSSRVEVWDDVRLVALVACYINIDNSSCFISNVSVAPTHLRQGLASRLLGFCISRVKDQGVRVVSLEVSKSSPRAIDLYKKHSFVVKECDGDFLKMECRL